MNTLSLGEAIRQDLKAGKDISINPIDLSLPVISPFIGTDVIKLIFIGQDPTIENVTSRKHITCTLNLDKKNTLRTYVNNICDSLGITIENVYATNLFKYFYTIPPAKTIDVLIAHLEPNLELLKKELAIYRNIPIITLGEPVLQLLVNSKSKVKDYWNYNYKTKKSDNNFTRSLAMENKLCKDFFPFPHQPSISKEFYKETIISYLQYMSEIINCNNQDNNII